MPAEAMEFNLWDKVIRKSDLKGGYRAIGTVERIWRDRKGRQKCHVRWIGALNLVRGRTDNHSWILSSTLAPLTEENLALLAVNEQALRAKRRAQEEERERRREQAYLDLQVGEKWVLPHDCMRKGVAAYHTFQGLTPDGTQRVFSCPQCGGTRTAPVDRVP